MPRLIKGRAIVADRHVLLRHPATGAELPGREPAIVPIALWLAQRDALIARGEVGVWLGPGDDPGTLAPDVMRLELIAIDFPSFTDGRGYSLARLLRQRHGYRGELRAIGDIGRDQLYYLAQCGFDAFSLPDSKDADDALKAFDDFSDGYQATPVRLPWFRRRQLAAGSAVSAQSAVLSGKPRQS
jgi:uncharacterized protein (DUF934 family)